ncbi:actin filament-associated protein 1-like 2 isoform X5 [Monodelphis domestica]|uniref:actin filament-associated protein 1-like 2 isoform X5 n=1 Tax=Monodelphis domestica TaxID=13616 RepID=UPI0024E200A0|nr:actin filament-associated protein 1-like 2 isoform X5 [Monodelphis domestica]
MEKYKAQKCCCLMVHRRILQVSTSLEQLLTELDAFLKILDKENLSSTAVVKKSFLTDLLRLYTKTSNSDEEYIYMNKVTTHKQPNVEIEGKGKDKDKVLNFSDPLTNGELVQHLSAPQKSLPDLPPPKIIPERKQLPVPKIESPEGYYEEAEPYDTSLNGYSSTFSTTEILKWVQVSEGVIYATIILEDGEPVSSSYESYDEEESSKSKSTPHQWPSPEATIELMKDARICAFLWRKKWLGQWAKQLCVIKDSRLLCYKSSKDHNPQLDVNLVGCSVVYKEKQVRKKEHNLKITPTNADVIVLGLQSKDQAEQWLRVIQEVSGLPSEGVNEGNQYIPDAQRLNCQKPDIAEKYLSAPECGSNVDGHPETTETKDVKKKGTAGLKLSNLMNLGRKKSASLENSERSLETSSYLNVLVNSQWKSRWCYVKDSHLHIYQDRNRTKSAQQPLNLVGCEVVPNPSPDHLYSFRILNNGEEIAMLEAKSSEEMGHWLGLLLSESGSKTDPEEFTYDYVDADRVSCIVSAAKTSFFLMQRKYSEPNAYIDNLPKGHQHEEPYDEVILDTNEPTPLVEQIQETTPLKAPTSEELDRVYLDLTPLVSFPPGPSHVKAQLSPPSSPLLEKAIFKTEIEDSTETSSADRETELCRKSLEIAQEQKQPERMESEEPTLRGTGVKIQTQQQKISFPQSFPDFPFTTATGTHLQLVATPKEKMEKSKGTSAAPVEIKLGKNRTEAEVKRYTEEKKRLEKEKEEIRSHLAQLRRERRELKDTVVRCTDRCTLACLEQKLKEMEEECKEKEKRRVDLELSIMEVKESLKKAEAGPVTLGTAVDTTHLENTTPKTKVPNPAPAADSSPVNSAIALKNRPLSVMVTGKGTVLRKALEWEKKGAS